VLSDGSDRLTTLLDLTEELWLETRLTGPFLVTPQAEPARPVLAVQRLATPAYACWTDSEDVRESSRPCLTCTTICHPSAVAGVIGALLVLQPEMLI
jgi:hypothetical protein